MIYLTWIISLIAIFFAGYFSREIKEAINKLNEKLHVNEPVEVGPTPGLYHRPNENKVLNDMHSKKVGAVMPKSPELLEFEEQERIKKMNGVSL